MHAPEHYTNLAYLLTNALDLTQPPIAITFTDNIPTGVPTHTTPAPAGCRFWQDAAEGAFATSAKDHALCSIGCYTHNLPMSAATQTDLADTLKVLNDLTYVTAQDLAQIPALKSQSKHILYSPLGETPLPPDVVLLFADASQTLILTEATQQVEDQNPPALGRPACAVVPQVINTGRAALSLGCCGARAYLDTLTDSVALFAIPGAKLEAYAKRIEALSKANTTLAKFHSLRRQAVAAGQSPTIKESLAALA
ncbi:hypothetical protein GCM10011507_30930 [Edaphobacter acidisoli]|uniref:Uncharacterized protein n=1 Tax=Edaphobacter acidisoli TaxID=2040573 RepID=A0A916RYT2_9BACT|nr:DUF169 domain-containing protein [Edaphobacter acidisoli]GGA77462.1 hypothetical protein GCM10011507_30930 [Edaphobacter acidisoli]